MYEKPTAPRSIGGVLDDGIRLWKQALAKTWLLAVFSRLIIAIPSIIFRTQAQDIDNLPLNERLMLMMGQSSRYSVWFLLLLLVSYAFHIAIQLRVAAEANDETLSFGEALTKGFKLLPRLMWFLIILFLGFLVIGLVVGFLSGLAAALAHLPRQVIVALSVSVVLLLILLPATRLLTGFVYMTVEDRPAYTALKSSWTLTRGHWWRITTILTVMAVIALVLAIVLYLMGAVAAGILGAFSLGTAILIQIVSVLLIGFLGSFYPSIIYSMYLDLKLRSEGADLAGRVNALASR